MHTNNLRKLASETNDGVLRGPAFYAADEIDRLRAEIDLLTKERQAFEGMAKDNYDRLQKAEAERDEARAQVSAAFVAAEKALESRKYGDPDEREEYAFDAALDRGIVAICALASDHAKAALEAYGRKKVREGMQRAADVAADRCAACGVREIAGLVKAHILADMEKLKCK